MEVTMIIALVAGVLICGVCIYITDIRKDRKILNDYLANKHKTKTQLKSSALARKETASVSKERG